MTVEERAVWLRCRRMHSLEQLATRVEWKVRHGIAAVAAAADVVACGKTMKMPATVLSADQRPVFLALCGCGHAWW